MTPTIMYYNASTRHVAVYHISTTKKTKAWICGATTYDNLRSWAKGYRFQPFYPPPSDDLPWIVRVLFDAMETLKEKGHKRMEENTNYLKRRYEERSGKPAVASTDQNKPRPAFIAVTDTNPCSVVSPCLGPVSHVPSVVAHPNCSTHTHFLQTCSASPGVQTLSGTHKVTLPLPVGSLSPSQHEVQKLRSVNEEPSVRPKVEGQQSAHLRIGDVSVELRLGDITEDRYCRFLWFEGPKGHGTENYDSRYDPHCII
eukprot:Rmarinus@m.24033